jgi:DNA primase
VLIPYAHVKEAAKLLEVGKQTRINHTQCSAGADTRRRLYVKRTNNAVLSYCHNCGGHGVAPQKRGLMSEDVMRRILADQEAEEQTREIVELPDDTCFFPSLWPAEAKAWLYKYHITDEDITNYSIGYSESWGRVILPVYENGKLVFWQGRSIDGAEPKYVSVRGAKKPVFITHTTRPWLSGLRRVAVVEDYLSAIRIARDTSMDAIALLGTVEPDDIVDKLEPYSYAFIWLDADDAGRDRALKVKSRLKLLSSLKHVSRTNYRDMQPKEVNPTELKDWCG